MAIRTRFSSLDMVRMAKFAKENPELKPIPLIKAYCDKYPEVTEEQKLANIRNWLHDNDIVRKAECSDECAVLPIQRVMPMLRLIATSLDEAIENTNNDNEGEWDKICTAVELLNDIAEDNKMFVRN